MQVGWVKVTISRKRYKIHAQFLLLCTITVAQTLLCILASYCFSGLAFCCFILYVLRYGVIINNNNKIIIIKFE